MHLALYNGAHSVSRKFSAICRIRPAQKHAAPAIGYGVQNAVVRVT